MTSSRALSEDTTIVGFVQARLGSERVPFKNLRLVGSKPLVAYGVEILRQVANLQDTYINTESQLIADVCREYGAKWYRRSEDLASSGARTEDWILDFVTNVGCDIVVVINPCVLFLKVSTVEKAISMVLAGDYDTVISGSPIRTHIIYRGSPLNFDPTERLPRTQDLDKGYALNFGVGVWRTQAFMNLMNERSGGVIAGRLGVVETDGVEGIDIDTEEDLRLAEACLLMQQHDPQYDSRVTPAMLSRYRRNESAH